MAVSDELNGMIHGPVIVPFRRKYMQFARVSQNAVRIAISPPYIKNERKIIESEKLTIKLERGSVRLSLGAIRIAKDKRKAYPQPDELTGSADRASPVTSTPKPIMTIFKYSTSCFRSIQTGLRSVSG